MDCLQIANVNVFVGGAEDAFIYNANGQGVLLDLPTLDPANRATTSGSYTGLIPPGYEGSKHTRNLGPEPPPIPPTKVKEFSINTYIQYYKDDYQYMKLLHEYASRPHPDRIHEWYETVPYQFIITFQGPSTIVGRL